jgi:putative membrane protein
VLVEARNLARQALTLLTRQGCDVRPCVLALVGFATAMRNQLREDSPARGLEGLLPPALIARLAAHASRRRRSRSG